MYKKILLSRTVRWLSWKVPEEGALLRCQCPRPLACLLLLALKVLSARGRRQLFPVVAGEIAMSRHIFCGRWRDFRPTSIQNHCVALKASDRPRLGCLPSSKLDETFFVKKFWNAVTNFCLPPAVVASRSLRNIQVFSPWMLRKLKLYFVLCVDVLFRLVFTLKFILVLKLLVWPIESVFEGIQSSKWDSRMTTLTNIHATENPSNSRSCRHVAQSSIS